MGSGPRGHPRAQERPTAQAAPPPGHRSQGLTERRVRLSKNKVYRGPEMRDLPQKCVRLRCVRLIRPPDRNLAGYLGPGRPQRSHPEPNRPPDSAPPLKLDGWTPSQALLRTSGPAPLSRSAHAPHPPLRTVSNLSNLMKFVSVHCFSVLICVEGGGQGIILEPSYRAPHVGLDGCSGGFVMRCIELVSCLSVSRRMFVGAVATASRTRWT